MPNTIDDTKQAPYTKGSKAKAYAVAEVLGVFSAILLVSWCIPITPIAEWQSSWLHWNFAPFIAMIALPIAILVFARRRLQNYGLVFRNVQRDVKTGSAFFLIIAIPTIVAYLFGVITLKEPAACKPLFETIIFQLLFSGFCEEFLFRGYFQSRLNHAFGRPWRLANIPIGPGIIIVTILFGIGHLLNPFNPFVGNLHLDWIALLRTTVAGFFFGLLLERSGAIIAPTIVHFADVWMDYFSPTIAFTTVVGIGWALAWLMLTQMPSARMVTIRPTQNNDRVEQPPRD